MGFRTRVRDLWFVVWRQTRGLRGCAGLKFIRRESGVQFTGAKCARFLKRPGLNPAKPRKPRVPVFGPDQERRVRARGRRLECEAEFGTAAARTGLAVSLP